MLVELWASVPTVLRRHSLRSAQKSMERCRILLVEAPVTGKNIGGILEFLEHGADTNIRLGLHTKHDQRRVSNRSRGDPMVPRKTKSKGRYYDIAVQLHVVQADGSVRRASHTRLASDSWFHERNAWNFIQTRGGEISFTEFVEFCNFDNKDALLGFLERDAARRRELTPDRSGAGEDATPQAADKNSPQERLPISVSGPATLPGSAPGGPAAGSCDTAVKNSKIEGGRVRGNALAVLTLGKFSVLRLSQF